MFTRQLLRASTRVNTRFTIRQAGVRNASSYVEKATGKFKIYFLLDYPSY